MSGAATASRRVELAGGFLVAPLLPGLVQHWKGRLQGRRGPTPLQPYRELRRLWGKSVVDPEGTGPVYRLAPAVAAASLGVAVLLVPVASRAPGLGVGRDFLVLVGLLALARFAVAAVRLGHRERLRADGREPRPHDRGRGRGDARARGRRRRAGRRHDRPARRDRGHRRHCRLVEPGARARRDRLRARRRRRDGAAADRQPRHPSRADDDPRRAAARVRRSRPRAPPVGRGGPALDRARARRADLPAARARLLGPARGLCRWPSSSCAPRSRSPRRSSRRCASCSCRGCSRSARLAALLGVVSWLVQVDERRLVWLLVAVGPRCRRRTAPFRRGRARHGAGAAARRDGASMRRRATRSQSLPRSRPRGRARRLLLLVVSRTREPRPCAPESHRSPAPASPSASRSRSPGSCRGSASTRTTPSAASSHSSPSASSPSRRDAPRSSTCSASCWSRTGSLSPRSSFPAAARRSRSSSASALDLTLVALVAAVFHERIFAEFGAGDSARCGACVTSREAPCSGGRRRACRSPRSRPPALRGARWQASPQRELLSPRRPRLRWRPSLWPPRSIRSSTNGSSSTPPPACSSA